MKKTINIKAKIDVDSLGLYCWKCDYLEKDGMWVPDPNCNIIKNLRGDVLGKVPMQGYKEEGIKLNYCKLFSTELNGLERCKECKSAEHTTNVLIGLKNKKNIKG